MPAFQATGCRARHAFVRALAACIALLGVVACSQDPERPETWQLEGGQTLAAVARDGRPAVVLVLDPADWFACSNIIADWLYWKQREAGNLRIVLTRTPSSRKRPMLASGIRWDHILRRPVADTPRELVFIGDSLVYHGRDLLRYATTPLLAALRTSALPEAVAAAQSQAASFPPQPPTRERTP